MKSVILAALTVLSSQSATAADLRIMQYSGAGTWVPTITEKIVMISTSNASGVTFVNVATASMMCVVRVADIAKGASIVSAVSDKATLECYTDKNEKRTGSSNHLVIETNNISIIKPLI